MINGAWLYFEHFSLQRLFPIPVIINLQKVNMKIPAELLKVNFQIFWHNLCGVFKSDIGHEISFFKRDLAKSIHINWLLVKSNTVTLKEPHLVDFENRVTNQNQVDE